MVTLTLSQENAQKYLQTIQHYTTNNYTELNSENFKGSEKQYPFVLKLI